ncbi:MAG TPA: VOC family protein [Rhizomicrobium sp.]|jgi:hypothetical protein
MRFSFAAAAAMLFASNAIAADKPMSSTSMSPAPIVFFDIAGPDAAKLKSFYAGIFDWNIDAANAIKTGALDGTLRQDPAEKIIYIGVPDIDAALAKIKAEGGSVAMPRTVIPNVVIFALFTDPAGNRMGLVETKK